MESYKNKISIRTFTIYIQNITTDSVWIYLILQLSYFFKGNLFFVSISVTCYSLIGISSLKICLHLPDTLKIQIKLIQRHLRILGANRNLDR